MLRFSSKAFTNQLRIPLPDLETQNEITNSLSRFIELDYRLIVNWSLQRNRIEIKI